MVVRAGSVVTPEAVRLEYSLGGIATRAFAKLIDLVVVAVVAGVVLLCSALLLFAGIDRWLNTDWGSRVGIRIAAALVIFVAAVFAIPFMEWLWRGRTPGKSLLGLRVVTDAGDDISMRHAMVRGLLQLVEIPTALAFFTALSNPRRQRLGDLAAGTIVIADNAEYGHATMIPTVFPPPPGHESFVAQLDVEQMTSEQFQLVRDYLLRCARIETAARQPLAHDIAASMATRLGAPAAGTMSPEFYLVCVASAYQQRFCPQVFDAARRARAAR